MSVTWSRHTTNDNSSEANGSYTKLLTSNGNRLAVGILFTACIALVAATQGSVNIPLTTVVKIAIERMPFLNIESTWPQSSETILWELRFPRVLLAGVVGGALALSGATYQALFRNPLASPDLIGVASGAGLGVTLLLIGPLPAYIFGISTLPYAAFLGALIAIVLAYTIARTKGVVPTTTLILAGVAMTSLAGAITTFLMLSVSQDIRPVLSWLLGSFASAGWHQFPIILPYVLLGSLTLISHSRILNVMQLDEEQAQQLGVNVERTKVLLIAAASLTTAAAVAVSGIVGFVGLVAPHAVRLIWGPNYRLLLPMAAIFGAAFLILADLAARTLHRPGELPVGVITALLGVPFFLYLLKQAKRGVF